MADPDSSAPHGNDEPSRDPAATGRPRSSGRRLLYVVIAGVVLYGALVVVRGTASIQRELSGFAWWTFAAACALSLANYLIRFLKWEYYLKVLGARPPTRGVDRPLRIMDSLLVFLSGFVLTITPGKVGEVFKSVVLRDLCGVPVARTAPIVVAERLTDLVGIIALITIGSVVFPGGLVWAGIGTAFVLSLLAFVSLPSLSSALLAPWKRAGGPVGAAARRAVPKVEQGLLDVRALTHPRVLWLPSLLSIAGWALEGVGMWLILRGFGASLDLARATFFYATATLAGALVPLPGGLGVTEKVLEESMVALGGVQGAVATAAMLLARLATLWFAVLVGFGALGALRALHPAAFGSSRHDRAPRS